MVARTGYTGEDGFELYCDAKNGEKLWDDLLCGRAGGFVPVGLGARDTLRLENAYPLYGHELDESTTPLEAGLEWVTKLSKPAFMAVKLLLSRRPRCAAKTGRAWNFRAGDCPRWLSNR